MPPLKVLFPLALMVTLGGALQPAWANSHPTRYFSSIVWAVMENHGVHQVEHLGGERYFKEHGATFAHYYAITHPSGPNYRAIVSGHTWTHQEVFDKERPTVASELNGIGIPTIDWYVGGKPDLKHNPYVDLHSKITIKPNGPFEPDTLPASVQVYLGYDDDDNAHNGPLSKVDENLQDLTARLNRSKWFNRADASGHYPVLMVSWDESFTAANDVYTSFYGHGVKAGYVSPVRYNHYNMCRTLTDNWGLPPLGDAAQAQPISDIWK
jgi:hypothetical protein